ncbi:VOC family protein [Micrococcales bacterium 31B]|nr:VOC family protein [Micrococcales bacterium 31B]
MQASLHVMSVFVADQAAALDFYTTKLGFVKKTDEPAGDYRWLTVVDAAQLDGVELLLEPNQSDIAQTYQTSLVAAGIPAVSFAVADLAAAHAELTAAGVTFTQEPLDVGPVLIATLDDTCGNLVQLMQKK